jgi:sulfatase maturation enzyme AslB (radical SAM superfamily)
MIMTFFLPATVLRSEGLWPRISVGQRFASMVRSFRALLHVVKLTRHAKRLHYRPDPTHPLVGTIVPATAASDLAPLTPPTPLIDPFGRTVTYLRVSVTDRCDFRCVYCMSEDMTFLPKRDLLTLEELDRVCTAFVEKGVRKLRITGGEPLVRRDIMRLFGSLSRHLHTGALNELTVTTNGSQLARHAGDLAGYGVRRINVSLDTLDPAKIKDPRRKRRGISEESQVAVLA